MRRAAGYYHLMTRGDVLDLFGKLNLWSWGDQRAPDHGDVLGK